MLTDSQREALTLRLRRGQPSGTGTIPRRPAGLAYPPASYGQEQLWLIDQLAPGQPAYNIPHVLRLSGALDQPALERALNRLVERHEVLRTRLVLTEDPCHASTDLPPKPGLVQVIGAAGRPVLGAEDLSGFAAGKREDALREFAQREALRPFDLAAGPLLRTYLVRLGPAEHALVVVVHHAVFDGWSAGVLVQDLAALYRSEATGDDCGLGELPVQFADYAVWERDSLRGQRRADLESYWRGALAGFETVQFPADRPRPVIDSAEGALAERLTDAGLLAGLRELSQREGVTLFTTLMAGVLAVLYRYTGQADLTVGTVSSGRGRPELAPLIGFLVNTLPVRCDLSGDPAFRAVLARVKEATVGAFAHQDLPFGQLVDALKIERDAGRTPVFQILLAYAEGDDLAVPAAGVTFARTDLIRGIDAAKFDLMLTAEARAGGLWIECSYKTALFDALTVERLLEHLDLLLHGAVADPSARLSALPLLTAAELRAEVRDWNGIATPVMAVCVHEGFEAQVARTPDVVAAEFAGTRWSYAELNRRANQIARRLRAAGVGPEALVGVRMSTGLPRLAALLGVWKAGGGYVPLDPALPAARLAFMIADAALAVVVTDGGAIPAAGVRTLSLDDDWDQLPGDDMPGAGVTPGNVAYVIYTSGSTGQPKGVVIEHRHAVNSLLGMAGQWEIGPGDAVLGFASIAFDASVMDMFMPLLAGARVVLAPSQTLHSPPRLAALLRDARITFACLPPAVLDLLPSGRYPDLRILMAGGDQLPAELARRWISPGRRLVNAYGPTEATVNATYAELDAASPMPPAIGFPAQRNYQAYVLDRHLNPVPAGVTGELHIGGASVARGYLDRPDLTRERFIPDPFRPGGRLYKTGDLVRRRRDGSLVFAGRIDGQVKIRGLRVELGEIEAVLAAHPAVAQAVVTVSGQQLAAYLRPAPGGAASEQELRAYLAGLLPAAMIPAHLVTVEAFPLNASGKVERSALPAPVSQRPAGEYAEPATPLEIVLADIYCLLLGTGRVGATDSFFDLGGNSLQAMRLTGMLSQELDVDIGAAAVFLAPTPRRLAALLRDQHGFRDED